MEPYLLLATFVIGIAAYEDYKTRLIQNEAVGLLWFIVWAFNVNVVTMVGVFAILLMGFAIWHKHYAGQEIFQFGDILIFPPVYAFTWTFGVNGLALLGAALLSFLLVGFLKRKAQPFVPCLAVVLLACCYLSYVSPA